MDLRLLDRICASIGAIHLGVPMDMDPLFLHIRVVMGIILGLAITTVLQGLASVIEHPQRRGTSPLHLCWAIWTLISLVTFWWWEFRLIEVHRWTFETYLFVIVYCASWFMLCALLFPTNLGGYGNYQTYLLQRRRWIFGNIALLTLLDLLDTAIKGESRWQLLGVAYPVHTAVMLLVAFLGWRLTSPRAQLKLAAATLLYQLAYFAAEYFTIGTE